MINTSSIKRPIVSVVIPVFNRKNRLKIVLKSLIDQDLSSSYEILVVDDGSTDGTSEDLELLDPKIRVIRQVNRGAAAARHCGVLNAKSDIVIYHDSDDIALPNKLTVMKEALQRHPECVAAISISKNPTKKNWKAPYWADVKKLNDVVMDKPLEHFFGNYYPLANAMNIAIRRDIALFAGANMEYFKAANDYQLQFKAATKGPFVCIPIVTHEYHVGDGIGAAVGSYVQEAYSLLAMFNNFDLLDHPQEYRHHVQRRSENDGPRITLMLVLRGNYSLAWQVFINSLKYGRIIKLPRRIVWAFGHYIKTKK